MNKRNLIPKRFKWIGVFLKILSRVLKLVLLILKLLKEFKGL